MKTFKVKTYSGWINLGLQIQAYFSNLRLTGTMRIKEGNQYQMFNANLLPPDVNTILENEGFDTKNLLNEIKIEL